MTPFTWTHLILLVACFFIVVSWFTIIKFFLQTLNQCDKQLDSLEDISNSKFSEETSNYLLNLNKEISRKYEIKEPVIKVFNDSDPNASAFLTMKNSYIAFSDIVLNSLHNEALGSVLAHEINHIKEKHFLKQTLIDMITSLFWHIIGSIPLIILYSNPDISFSLSTSHQIRVNLLLILNYFIILTFVQWLVIKIPSLFFSRKYEIESDLFAIKNTSKQAFFTQAMYFHNLSPDFYRKQKTYKKIFNTHPSWEKRIALIDNSNCTLTPIGQT